LLDKKAGGTSMVFPFKKSSISYLVPYLRGIIRF
jgi:hypothetical protein